MNDSIKNAMNAAARASLSRLVSMELATCELMAAEFAKIATNAQECASRNAATQELARCYRQAAVDASAECNAYKARCESLRFRLLDLK